MLHYLFVKQVHLHILCTRCCAGLVGHDWNNIAIWTLVTREDPTNARSRKQRRKKKSEKKHTHLFPNLARNPALPRKVRRKGKREEVKVNIYAKWNFQWRVPIQQMQASVQSRPRTSFAAVFSGACWLTGVKDSLSQELQPLLLQLDLAFQPRREAYKLDVEAKWLLLHTQI